MFKIVLLILIETLTSFSHPSINLNTEPHHPLYLTHPDGLAKNASLHNFYDSLPNLATCYAGVLKQVEKIKVQDTLNYLRRLHGLKPVSYQYSDDIFEAQAALIMAANMNLSHTPDSTWLCYSADGASGAGTSNLILQSGSFTPSSEKQVFDYLVDLNVGTLGHRRWVIYPFLKYTTFGRVDGSNVMGGALKVIFAQKQNLADLTADFVAYPVGRYPTAFFDKSWYLNFQILIDKINYWNNSDVNYLSGWIEIISEAGETLATNSQYYDNAGYGLNNNLQWKVTGLKDNIRYNVFIHDLIVAGVTKSYAYWFRLEPGVPSQPGLATLVYPDSGQKNLPSSVPLRWQGWSMPETYQLQVASDSLFQNMFIMDSLLKDTTRLVSNLDSATTYYWRVRVIRVDQVGRWTKAWSFSRMDSTAPLPNPVALISPANDSIILNDSLNFIWHRGAPSPLNYTLKIAADTLLNTSLIETVLTDTLCHMRIFLPENSTYFWSVLARNSSGLQDSHEIRSFKFKPKQVLVSEGSGESTILTWMQNYPNPFLSTTQIDYLITTPGTVTLTVYDRFGRTALTVSRRLALAGRHEFSLNFSELPSGIYLCRLKSGRGEAAKTLAIIK